MITSANCKTIESVSAGLIERYGDITRKDGPLVNYLGMVFDLTTTGVARVSMTGYVEEMLRESGTTGGARTPATASLFDVRDGSDMATEEQRVKFHSVEDALLGEACEAGLPHGCGVPGDTRD